MKKLWFSPLLLVTCISFGMEKEPVQGFMPSALLVKMGQSSTSALFGEAIPRNIITAINEVPKDGYIGIDMQYLTDDNIIKALIEAKKRGVELQITIRDDERNMETVNKLLGESITVQWSPYNHCKRVLLSALRSYNINIYNQKKLKLHCIVFEGSYNGSRIAHNHQEIMVKTSGDPAYFMQHYHDHQNVMQWTYPTKAMSKLKNVSLDPGIEGLPIYKKVINSFNTQDWLASLARALWKLQQGDEIDVTTMTIDNQYFLAALRERSKAGVNVRLFVDPDAIKNFDISDKLSDVVNAGGSVFVYNPHGVHMASTRYPALLHAKSINILRHKNNELMTIISSGNFTDDSISQINHTSYHPNNRRLYNQVKGLCTRLLSESMPLKQYINLPQVIEQLEIEEELRNLMSARKKPRYRY